MILKTSDTHGSRKMCVSFLSKFSIGLIFKFGFIKIKKTPVEKADFG